MDRNGITDANMDIAGQTIEMLPIWYWLTE
jgi:hypothetical protein